MNSLEEMAIVQREEEQVMRFKSSPEGNKKVIAVQISIIYMLVHTVEKNEPQLQEDSLSMYTLSGMDINVYSL